MFTFKVYITDTDKIYIYADSVIHSDDGDRLLFFKDDSLITMLPSGKYLIEMVK